jgi:hypothetical protein
MRTVLRLIAGLVGFSLLCAVSTSAAAEESAKRILFAGSSLLDGGASPTNHYTKGLHIVSRLAIFDGHPKPIWGWQLGAGAGTTEHRYGRDHPDPVFQLDPLWWEEEGENKGVIWESWVVSGGYHWDAFLLQGGHDERMQDQATVDTFRDNVTALAGWFYNHSPNGKFVLHRVWATARGRGQYGPGYVYDSIEEEHAALVTGYNQALGDVTTTYPDKVTAISPAGDGFALLDWDETLVDEEPDGTYDYTTGLYRWFADQLNYGGYDGSTHQASRGKLIAAMIMYNTIYEENSSDIYGKNPDYAGWDPSYNGGIGALLDGPNGVNDVEDMIVALNDFLLGDEAPLTVADWQTLAQAADMTRSSPVPTTSSSALVLVAVFLIATGIASRRLRAGA